MGNLAMLVEMAAGAMGDRVAVGSLVGGITYAQLRDLAAGASRRVAAAANGTVAYVGEFGEAVPVALFAAAWAGASYAPLNYRLPPAQVGDLLGRLEPGYVVDDPTAWLAGLRADPPNPATGYVDEPQRPAVLLYTSGTSAAPKAATLDHVNMLAYILNAGEFMSAEEDEAVLMVVPPFHIAGVAGLLSSIYAGRRIVPSARFTPEGWLDAVRRESVTHAFVVPTMLARIVATLEQRGGDGSAPGVPSLRALSYGGARMPVPLLERAMRLFPNAGFVNAYGLTETSSTVTLLGPDEHTTALGSDDPAVRARLGSVGRPLPGVEVEVVDDDGRPIPAGGQGRIRIRGPQVSGNYVGVVGGTDGGGWLLTGDVGSIDLEGYVFVEGRADDVIIAGGENLSPGEIEDCLLKHPRVTGAAVVGLPDPEWGERVAAMVTVLGDVAAEELQEWVRADLGTLKSPKTVGLVQELPMTPTGKILRREVKAALLPKQT